MAATADLLPPLKAPNNMHNGHVGNNFVRAKQSQSLDIVLLCDKLEAHKREQDASRGRREQRNTIGAAYVPQYAARQFAATATPMDLSKQSHSSNDRSKRFSTSAKVSNPAPGPGKPVITGSRIHLNSKQLYAALNSGMSENEALAASAASASTKHRSISSRAQPRDSPQDSSNSGTSHPEHDTNDKDHYQPLRLSRDTDRPSHQSYKPGDAAKRRSAYTLDLFHPSTTTSAHRPTSSHDAFTPILELRKSSTSGPLDPLLPDAQRAGSASARPRLVPSDRPNWSQVSQCGDDMRHVLHLPRFGAKARVQDDPPAPGARARSEIGLRMPAAAGATQQQQSAAVVGASENRRQSENLIADAVRLIKKEEKVRRRGSLVGFFKRS